MAGLGLLLGLLISGLTGILSTAALLRLNEDTELSLLISVNCPK